MENQKEQLNEELDENDENLDINNVLTKHVIGAMAVGLIPMPVIDLVALTGVQLNLVRKISQIYKIPFSQDKVKNILASLIGSGLSVTLSKAFASFLKVIPIIGQTTGVLAMPLLAGASTYAVGKVFIHHFESGGTFLNFNPETVKEYYEAMFKEGKKVVSNLKKNEEIKKDNQVNE
ncbi:MAG: DUF697 domain-containing protein [Desulfobacterales bacterium]|nr:DUF697 domain-containing protein [Desulfobacterales bacterium]